MNNQNNFHLNSLAWVKHEISVSLDEAREEVLAYANHTGETEHLHEAMPLIKDVLGTLEVAELSGAAMLAEECLAVVGELAEGSIRNTGEASRLVVRALIQLPDYLDFVQSSQEDEPVILVSILNDLKATRNQEFISSDIIDIPQLEKDEAVLDEQEHSGESLQRLAHLTRHVFELGLLGWYRNQNATDSLRKMALVCRRLRFASEQRGSRRLWWVTEALISALQSNLLPTSAAVKALVGKVDREIKRLFEVGEKEFAATISLDLVKSLLYYVANAQPGNRVVDEVRKAYFLEQDLPSEKSLSAARISMSGQNDKLYLSVAKALAEDVEDIKDQMEVYSRAERQSIDDLASLGPLLGRLSETLGMLGLAGQKDKIAEQQNLLGETLAQHQLPDDNAITELAGSLVEIESAIAAFGVLGRDYAVAGERGESSDLLSEKIGDVEFGKVRTTVLKESLAEIEQCKNAIQIYATTNRDFNELEEIPAILNHLTGAMLLLSFENVVSLLNNINDFISQRICNGPELNDAEIDKLAEAISGAEVYLEVMDTSGIDQQNYLDAGQRAVESLLNDEVARESVVEEAVVISEEPEQEGHQDAVMELLDEISLDIDSSEPPATLIDDDSLEKSLHDFTEYVDTLSGVEGLTSSFVFDELDASQLREGVDPALLKGIDARAVELENALAEEGVDDEEQAGPLTLVDILPDDEFNELDFELPGSLQGLEALSDGVDEEIYEIFLEEFAEQAEQLKESFPKWRNDSTNEEALTRLRRSFHTLKGSGRLIGAQIIGEFAWLHEEILNQIIDHRLDVSQEVIDCLDGGIDLLPVLERQLRARSGPDEAVVNHVLWAEKIGKGQLDEHWREPLEVSTTAEDTSDSQPEDRTMAIEAVPDLEAISLLDGLGEELEDQSVMERQADHTLILNEGELQEPTRIAAELLEIFATETGQHQAVVNSAIETLREGGAEIEIDAGLLRALHTMNGSARTADVPEIYLPSSAFERYLSLKKEHALKLNLLDGELLSQFHLHVQEVLAALVENNATDAGDELTLSLEHLANEVAAREVPEPDDVSVADEVDTTEPPETSEEPEDAGEEAGPEAVITADMDLAPMPGLSASEPQPSESDGHAFELVEIFLEECAEILETCDDVMNRWQKVPDDLAPVMELRRELHTLKGGARMAGLKGLGDLSHAMESLFIDVIEGRLEADKNVFAVINGSFDRVNEMAEAAHANQTPGSIDELTELLSKLRSGKPLVEKDFSVLKDYKPDSEADIETSPASESVVVAEDGEPFESRLEASMADETATIHVAAPRLQEAVKVQSGLLDRLVDNIGEVSVFQARVEQQMSGFGFNLQELEQTIRRLTDQLRNLEIEAEAQVLHRFEDKSINPDASGIYEQFDPLELDRYSKVQQLSRSLAESTSDLMNLHQLLEDGLGDVESLLQKQSRVSNDLQEGLMRTRMSKFKVMVPRLRRVVRRTAMELGKDVELKVSGAENEMDRKLLESLVAPMEHMMRNAVAHGIEAPDDRKKKGKPATGEIAISIFRQGPEVVFEISDDGAGLDRDSILNKALEQGLVEQDQELTDAEINALIIQPGFTTAQEVSQIAGRGVGMDVVQNQIGQLNGVLDISSKAGQGTRFCINLPFTLAINQALLIQAGSETYAIPLDSIEGVVQVAGKSLAENLASDTPLIEYGDKEYSLYQLASVLERTAVAPIDVGQTLPVILARAGEHSAAFVADALLGNREVVVKSIGSLLSKVKGISGATILGDGGVVLILDTMGLIRTVINEDNVVPASLPQLEEKEDQRPIVMVVDDSITIRKVTARVLERNHYHVVTAKDGLDAVAQLKECRPDIMLLDIEMPRMDGFELAALIRNTKENEDLPIIMISSRSGRKHRERAMGLGVNRFLGKPYQDNELLENIEMLLV